MPTQRQGVMDIAQPWELFGNLLQFARGHGQKEIADLDMNSNSLVIFHSDVFTFAGG